MPVGQMSVGGAIVYGPKHKTDTQGRASLNVWSAQCQGLRRRQHRTKHKGHTHSPHPAGNQARAAGLEGTLTLRKLKVDVLTVHKRGPRLSTMPFIRSFKLK